MTSSVDTVLAEARKLAPQDQAALLYSLHELVAPADPNWEAAWDQECADRLAAYRRGEIEAIDSEQAMMELRRKHALA
jgi:hypothetical protein